MILLKFAKRAGRNTNQTNTPNQADALAVGIEEIKPIGRADVYNMEVCGTHNFAVNGGYIVHNCMDSMRYFVKTMNIVRKKDRYD